MVVTEEYETHEDGMKLVRSYSDSGKMISRNGELYEDAIDPLNSGRIYEETDVDVLVSDTDALSELKAVLT